MVRIPTHVSDNVMVYENQKKTALHSHHNGNSLRKETAKHTLRCLIGCNIGEGIGAALGFVLGMDMTSTLILAIGLAFAMGYAFTMIPMLRTMSLKQGSKSNCNWRHSKYSSHGNCRNLISDVDTRIYACWINRYIILDRTRNNIPCWLCGIISGHVLGYETGTTDCW